MPGLNFMEDFDGVALDEAVWVPYYLPQWSSRAASAAAYQVDGSALRVEIPVDHPLWCADEHSGPLRVSGIQSGVFSGPVGTTIGQQPFQDGLVVREEQPEHWGWTPHLGRIEVAARMELSARSMASVWMVGLEDRPERSGEICLFEVFGDTISSDERRASVGSGIHAFRDPTLHEEFSAQPMAVDVRDLHAYAVDWHPGRVEFSIDGRVTRTTSQAPDYPMQVMIAVFDFPDRAVQGDAGHVPHLTVDWIRGSAAGR
ncbi:MAG: hypothetical protein JWP10_922 [Nocardioidaceae bacterium]|nr:hypothetical protein [Nocardioidaceae bacterium]